MYCSKCGANVPENATFCSACGQPTGVASGGATGGVPGGGYASTTVMTPAAVAAPNVKYAGFWLRFVAFIIDAIVLGCVGFIVMVPFRPIGGFMHGGAMRPEDFAVYGAGFGRLFLVRWIISWLYYALLESSAWQATLGKKALGLEVTDLGGRRINFGRATGRFFAKIISTLILFIGFFMIGFTAKKQGLHDIIAGTLVLRKI